MQRAWQDDRTQALGPFGAPGPIAPLTAVPDLECLKNLTGAEKTAPVLDKPAVQEKIEPVERAGAW